MIAQTVQVEQNAFKDPSAMMADESQAAILGSASWIGADAYDVGDELHERATCFFNAVNWDVLARLSSKLRAGVPCSLSEKYSIGHFNMVARLRLPQLRAVFGDREALDSASTLKVEVASMKFIRYVLI